MSKITPEEKIRLAISAVYIRGTFDGSFDKKLDIKWFNKIIEEIVSVITNQDD